MISSTQSGQRRTYTRTVKFGEEIALPANVISVRPVFLRDSGTRLRVRITVCDPVQIDASNARK